MWQLPFIFPDGIPTLPCPGRSHRELETQEQAPPLCIGQLKVSWAHSHKPRTCWCLVPEGYLGVLRSRQGDAACLSH